MSKDKVIDYHDICSIDTPEVERRKIGIGDIYINAAKCKSCGDYIRSRNRHDYRVCACGNLHVDGGSWYAKRSVKNGMDSMMNVVVPFSDVSFGEE